MASRKNLDKRLTRRELLGLTALAGAATVVACGDDDKPSTPGATQTRGGATATSPAAAATGTRPASTLSCIVTPEMTEGPFFVDEMLNRSDIRSDPGDNSVVDGTPLALGLNVYQVQGDACTPLAGALVDVWHCDAEGRYSDVGDTAGQKFLRGYQLTDENGSVQFATVYPGWYAGRAVHVHFKVRTDPDAQQSFAFTSQLFFDDAQTEQVYSQAPYSGRGTPDTPNASDSIFQDGGDQTLLQLTRQGDGYAGSFDIGVQMS